MVLFSLVFTLVETTGIDGRRSCFNQVSNLRGFWPENYYTTMKYGKMKMPALTKGIDPQADRFIDWIEQGAFDALQKSCVRYLCRLVAMH